MASRLKGFALAAGLALANILGSKRARINDMPGMHEASDAEEARIMRKERQVCLPKWYGKPRPTLAQMFQQNYDREVVRRLKNDDARTS